MSDDEDADVVIPGTELSKFLENNFKGLYEPYNCDGGTDRDPRSSSLSLNLQSGDCPSVDGLMRSVLDVILHSNLLLDDDASYLYETSSQLLVVKTGPGVWAVVSAPLSAFLAAFLCSKVYLKREIFSPLSGFLLCAEVLCLSASLYCGVKAFREKLKKKLVEDLCRTLQKIYYYVRKMLQFLREQNRCIFSKELFCQMGQGKKEPETFSYLKRKSDEILVTIKCLIQCLLDLIFASQVFTVGLINIVPLSKTMDSADNYLAYCTFDQLGVSKYIFSDNLGSNELSSNISSVEVLKHIYLLMQSECLRRLGLCFCPSVWHKCVEKKALSKVFQRVKQYNRVCNNVLNTLEHQYNVNFFSKTGDNESSKNLVNSKLVEGYSVIHRYSLSLNSLLCESRMIEDYIDQNGSSEGSLNTSLITSKLEAIEREYQDSFQLLQNAKRYFSLMRNKSNASEENKGDQSVPDVTPNLSCLENNPGTAIGYSDFTPRGGDKVYLCVTDGMKESNVCGEYDVNAQPKLPQYLLKELKGALTNKKQEFELREMEALKNNPDYEQYKNFEQPSTDSEPKPAEESESVNCVDEKPHTKKRLHVEVPMNVTSSSNGSCGMNLAFQKCLASEAVSASFKLNNSDEEIFGSGSDSDS